ncbi:MAG: hypothetical protein ACP5N2_02755 [Candidatus Nanoarchaeia archaeon]
MTRIYKIILLILGAVVMLGLVLFLVFLNTPSSISKSDLTKMTVAQKSAFLSCDKKQGDSRDACLTAIAIINYKVKEYDLMCSFVENQSKTIECYEYVGMLRNDPSVCESIQNAITRNLCMAKIKLGSATGKAGISRVCSSLQDEKKMAECSAAFEEFAKKEALRQTMAADNSSEWNLEMLKQSYSELDIDSLRKTCFDEPTTQKQDECFYIVAYFKPHIESCSDIMDAKTRVSCMAYGLMRYYEENRCEEFVNNATTVAKDMCYSSGAITFNESQACEKIENSNMKDSCYINLAFQSQNADLCIKVNAKYQTLCSKSARDILYHSDCMYSENDMQYLCVDLATKIMLNPK